MPDFSGASLPAPVMSRRGGIVIMIAVLVTLLVAVLDTNIVISAAPSIAEDFGSNALAQLPWLVTAYALAETVTQPIYGRLADRFGVRPVLLSAIGLFLAGSMLCGAAWSMPVLVALRVVQGLGASGLLSVTFTLIGHLRAQSERDDVSGGNAASGVLLAIGLICGPLVGGALIAHVGWRWVFWVNVPILAVVLIVMARFLRLPDVTRKASIDWRAAAGLGVAAIALQAVCLWGGHEFAWASWQIVAAALTALLATAYFVRRQIRSNSPFFARSLLQNGILRKLTVLQLGSGIGLAGFVIYLTIYLQVVRGLSPLVAGLQLIPMGVGAIIGSIVGTILLRRGAAVKASFVSGTALAALTLAALALTTASTPIAVIWMILMSGGFGTGITMGNELLVIQSTVPLHQLGTATSGTRFVETLGTSAGAAVFGLIFSAVVNAGDLSPDATLSAVRTIFGVAAGVMALTVVAAIRLPATLPTGRPRRQVLT